MDVLVVKVGARRDGRGHEMHGGRVFEIEEGDGLQIRVPCIGRDFGNALERNSNGIGEKIGPIVPPALGAVALVIKGDEIFGGKSSVWFADGPGRKLERIAAGPPVSAFVGCVVETDPEVSSGAEAGAEIAEDPILFGGVVYGGEMAIEKLGFVLAGGPIVLTEEEIEMAGVGIVDGAVDDGGLGGGGESGE